MEITKEEARAILHIMSSMGYMANKMTPEQREDFAQNSPRISLITLLSLQSRLEDFVQYNGIK